MAKLKTRYRSLEPEGSQVNAFGYVGTVCADGVIVADVPDDLVDGEIEAGRFEAGMAQTEDTKPAKGKKSADAEPTG